MQQLHTSEGRGRNSEAARGSASQCASSALRVSRLARGLSPAGVVRRSNERGVRPRECESRPTHQQPEYTARTSAGVEASGANGLAPFLCDAVMNVTPESGSLRIEFQGVLQLRFLFAGIGTSRHGIAAGGAAVGRQGHEAYRGGDQRGRCITATPSRTLSAKEYRWTRMVGIGRDSGALMAARQIHRRR